LRIAAHFLRAISMRFGGRFEKFRDRHQPETAPLEVRNNCR
jgi:hypothetical protein